MSSCARQLFGVQRVAFCGLFLLAAMLSGCAAPRVQSHAPEMARWLVGPRACPHCGLLAEQGCCCQPDMWNYGYHTTVWRPLHPCPHDAPQPSHEPTHGPPVPPPATPLPDVLPEESSGDHENGQSNAAPTDQSSSRDNRPPPIYWSPPRGGVQPAVSYEWSERGWGEARAPLESDNAPPVPPIPPSDMPRSDRTGCRENVHRSAGADSISRLPPIYWDPPEGGVRAASYQRPQPRPQEGRSPRR